MTAKQNESTQQKIVIGVFITRKHLRDLITMNPELISSYRYVRFIELARASQGMNALVYFFADGHVSFEKKYVQGIYYDFRLNRWKEKGFPLPQALYDRGGGLSPKSLPMIQKLRELGIKNINGAHFFDKWDLYDRLSGLDLMRPHLPVTFKGDKAISVMQILNQFGRVYVKTRRGSCGTGVIRIEQHGPDRYRYFYSCGGKLFSAMLTGRELIAFMERHFARKPFIIQQPIDLLQKGDGIIDFRSEVQKNERGEPVVLGTAARIGKAHSPIASNTHATNYYPFEVFVKEKMQLDELKARELQVKVERFLQNVFRAVEHVYGSFGELGIDFGLDTRGHLWLIECNSKSAKVALYRAYGRQKVRESFRNLLQYARYLLGEMRPL